MTRRQKIASRLAGCLGACLIIVSLPSGCGRDEAATEIPSALEAVPLTEPGGGRNGPLFEGLDPQRTGIDFVHIWNPPQELAGEIATNAPGCGVATGDYDGDGLADLFLSRQSDGGRLYRNLGDFRFADVTGPAGLDTKAGGMWSAGASFVDIDDDGDLDLYVCGFRCPNRLYINQGDGTFSEEAQAFGLDFTGASTMMAFADYDLDGDIDGYLVTNRLPTLTKEETFEAPYIDGKPTVPARYEEYVDMIRMPGDQWKMVPCGQFDHLYRNNGDGTFTDVSEAAGIDGKYMGLAGTWWDYNHDGRPDIYVSNDFTGADQLYHNNGDGTFTDVIEEAMPHIPWFSMGADYGDINNDGLLDFLAADMAGTTHYKSKLSMGEMSTNRWFLETAVPRQYMRNAVYLHSGTGRFLEVAYLTGLASTDWTWSTKFADLDNDGWIDLFATNGMTRDFLNSDLLAEAKSAVPEEARTVAQPQYLSGKVDFWAKQPKKAEMNLAFRNLGDLAFDEVSDSWGLGHVGVSYGASLADLDGDGDLDAVVNNFEEPPSVYRNNAVQGHRVKIRLRGTVSNSHGIGALVRIENADEVQVRYLTLAHGFMSADEPVVHFGLGERTKIERLTIHWPGGQVQAFENLAADQLFTITEPSSSVTPVPDLEDPAPLFEEVTQQAGLFFRHSETPYNDYAKQSLLPAKFSQLGPGLAWGDANGDGLEDFFVGGAAGQAGVLYLARGDGHFRRALQWLPDGDEKYEDMAALWFDADGDNDQDLYVASGSYEWEPADPLLQDRLYLNDGAGKFTRAPEGTLPEAFHSSSAVAASDFDRDGDLDLFVGGRVIPGQYPLPPQSQLLRNEGGRFEDVTDALAPALRNRGLVTGALWSDADNDGRIDLLVTCEWGPVSFFRNTGDQLEDQTDSAQLAELLGWWNGIAGADLDSDGDIDYVVTNVGLNSKYHASKEKPTLLYYGDFEGTGHHTLVEAEFEDETLFPMRGKSCSTNAMPFLKEKYHNFQSFALASLGEIYTPQCLNTAHRLTANTLESGVLLNDGEGRFAFHPLPRSAQAAPAFGAVLTDVDADGRMDLYLVQNSYSPQPETGRMDGGLSLLLRGDGNGRFTPVWPHRSGLLAPGDAKALAVCDLNVDGRPDFVVTQNDERLLAFQNSHTTDHAPLAIRLLGPRGNPTGIGARVKVLQPDRQQTAEVAAGNGYLSQSSSWLFFGRGPVDTRIEVEWPDGQRSTTIPPAGENRVTVEYPASTQVASP